MQFPENVRAALIDMDGVLYDSMPRHANAWHKLMTEQGLKIDPVEYFLYEGMTGTAIIQLLFKRDRGIDLSLQQAKDLYAIKSRYFNEQGSAPLMPGADRMLRTLKDRGVTPVLVTGSAQLSLIDRIQHDYPGIFSPEKMVTGLDVTHCKPDPEPYLKGLQLAGTRPDQTIVIENAPLGVRAGRAAGLFTVAVTTGPVPLQAFIDEDASVIFPSMPDFADTLPELL